MTYRLGSHRESYIALICSSAQDLGDGRQPSKLDAPPLSIPPPPLYPGLASAQHTRMAVGTYLCTYLCTCMSRAVPLAEKLAGRAMPRPRRPGARAVKANR